MPQNSDIALAFTVPVSVSQAMASTPTPSTPTSFPPSNNTDIKSQVTVLTVPTSATTQGSLAAAGLQVIGQGGAGWPSILSPITYIPASLPGGATTILSPQIFSTARMQPMFTTSLLGLNPAGTGTPQIFTLAQAGTPSSSVPMIRVAIPQMTSSAENTDKTS